MDQSQAKNSADPAASPSESRGWRGALAGVFGRSNASQPDAPAALKPNGEAPGDGPAPAPASSGSKPAAKAETIRQICELIRTPLDGLIGMTNLVSAGGLTPAQAQYMAVIQSSVAEALSTLEDVTELASEDQRFIEPVSRPFAATQILDALAVEFASQCKSRQLKLTCSNNLPASARLEGDLARFTNIARRILRIAVRHNEHSAFEFSISATPRNAPAGSAPATATAVTAQITLGDFQIGLPTEKADRILRGTPRADELWAQDGQTGLTLRACRAAVATLGGTLAIASAGNGLSRVLISLPMKMSISTAAAASTSQAGTAQAGAVPGASTATESGTPAPAAGTGPALIDVEALTARCVNNKAVAAAVLESLARMLPEKLTGLRDAIEASDAEKACTIAHTIKGSAANAAVEAVRSKALQIELMAKAADLDGITGAFPALEKAIKSVLTEIPYARASLTAPTAKAAA